MAFFLELAIILEEKVQNLGMIPSNDLFFLENTLTVSIGVRKGGVSGVKPPPLKNGV